MKLSELIAAIGDENIQLQNLDQSMDGYRTKGKDVGDMKLSELIAAIGDENIQLQNLDQSMDGYRTKGAVTKITFGTIQPCSLDGTQKLGLIVWLDRDKVKEITGK